MIVGRLLSEFACLQLHKNTSSKTEMLQNTERHVRKKVSAPAHHVGHTLPPKNQHESTRYGRISTIFSSSLWVLYLGYEVLQFTTRRLQYWNNMHAPCTASATLCVEQPGQFSMSQHQHWASSAVATSCSLFGLQIGAVMRHKELFRVLGFATQPSLLLGFRKSQSSLGKHEQQTLSIKGQLTSSSQRNGPKVCSQRAI